MDKDRNTKFLIEPLKDDEAQLLYALIIEMATYEKDLHEVVTSPERISETICNGKYAQALIGRYADEPAAYVIYYYTYSSYLGKPSIYIEDIYIRPSHRKLGLGKSIMSYMARLTLAQDCGRLDWTCLDWNSNAIGFYKHLGAQHLDNRLYFRAEGEALEKLAEK